VIPSRVPWFVALLLTGVVGCDTCGERTVPFKRDAASEQRDASPARDANIPRADAAIAEHDGGKLTLGGLEVPVAGALASLRIDLDRDGLRDALVFGASGTKSAGSAGLWFLRGGESAFSPATQLPQSNVELPEGCTLEGTHFQRLSDRTAALRTTLSCKGEAGPSEQQRVMLLSLDASPRLLERFVIRPAADSALTLASLTADDTDSDGHDDVQLQLKLAGATADLTLRWLDRPSGLSRDSAEPEATLLSWAESAEARLDDAPEQAMALADATLRLHAAVCREPGAAAISVSGSWGLSCGASRAAGRAALARVIALANAGNVVGALMALERLKSAGFAIDAKQRQRAHALLAERATSPAWSLRELPTNKVPLPAPRPAVPPSVRFLRCGRL